MWPPGEQRGEGAQQSVHRCRLAYVRRIRACAFHRIEPAVANVGDAPLLQSNAQYCAVAVRKRVVHDRTGQPVMLDQDQRVANGGRLGDSGAGLLKRLPYIHADQRFIFDDEDRASSQCWVFHTASVRG